MIRENLDDIPDFGVPAGYTIRWFRPGDEKSWRNIHLLADKYTNVTPDLFEREFGSNARLLAERQCFLLDRKNSPIGTASAWFDNPSEPSSGRIHWVAIIPAEQGKGLAKPLLTTACKRFKALDYQRAHLTTQTVRISAINLYLKFGFAPAIDSERERKIWQLLQKHLKYSIDV